jgi:hypothetical protein
MRYPGEVWYLPREAREEGDTKGRRHVLLTPCREAGDHATLAYASTQPTDARRGGAHVWIDPARTRYGATGLTGFNRPTYVYPCRLVNAASEEMDRMVGRLIDEMAEVRSTLADALGLGTGTCDGSGGAEGSWRGRVVRITDALAEETEFLYGVTVTEPGYSRRRRYQLVIPLLNEEEFEADPLDIRVDDPSLAVLGREWNSALIATRLIQTAFHRREIAAWTGLVVTDAVMSQIDEALRSLFAL